MAHSTAIEKHKAAKQHRCTWCWQRIAPGEPYCKYRWFNGNDTGVVKAHPECMSEINRYAIEEGGFFEWTPGMERPEKENNGTVSQ